jgi:hypothetical protein
MATVINRAIYSNVGGAQKRVTALYDNIGGARKTMSAAYANISGTRKQIHPYSTSTVYTWQKYSIRTSTSWSENTEDISYRGSGAEDLWEAIPRNTTLYYSTTGFTKSGNTVSLSNYKTSQVSTSFGVSDLFDFEFYIFIFDYFSSSKQAGTYHSISLPEDNKSTVYIYEFLPCSSDGSIFGRTRYELTLNQNISKGSTSYGTVTSSSKSAYPTNGAQDGYWYVFVS